MTALADVAVVVPIKSFALAKSRLADSLSSDSRRELARHCAEAVLRAASPLSVYVVCNDDEVAAWARANGAHVVVPGVLGLNAAATAGRDAARAAGHHRVMVAHTRRSSTGRAFHVGMWPHIDPARVATYSVGNPSSSPRQARVIRNVSSP